LRELAATRALYARETTNFMPRIGFAYSVTPKTVVRGGFGVYYGSLGTRLEDAIQTGFIQTTTVVPTLDGGQTFAATLANHFRTVPATAGRRSVRSRMWEQYHVQQIQPEGGAPAEIPGRYRAGTSRTRISRRRLQRVAEQRSRNRPKPGRFAGSVPQHQPVPRPGHH